MKGATYHFVALCPPGPAIDAASTVESARLTSVSEWINLDRLDCRRWIMTWQLQEAKNRLSELVDAAACRGPQIITRRGVPAAVVLSMEEYRKVIRPQQNLVQFFRESPLAEVELDLSRSQDLPREVEL
jgi:prevent-host-death family protein